MKVSKNGKTFEITGIDDAAIAARFLRQCGFTVVDELLDPRSPTLRAADEAFCSCKIYMPSPNSTLAKCRFCGKPPHR